MPLLYRKQGHTGILTLSRPGARNCWGQDYNEGLRRHLDEAADDDEVRSLILNGYAIGIGCIITFCCDLIVASDKAEWSLPQVALGILPNYGGATRLARHVGKGLAMRMAMGFPLDAEEAWRIGLAQWLVPHAELMTRALAVADHIAGLPPLAVRMVKESLNRGQDIPNIADASLVDSYRFMVLEMSEDKAEAHEAWRERRKPRFRGR
jgi:enoyl-CoA hydratase/carnithine racemase